MTSTRMANLMLDRKLVTKRILDQKKSRYEKVKKLTSTISRRLDALEKREYVSSKIIVSEKKQEASLWSLTFRGCIVAQLVFDEVRKNWKVLFKHYRNVMPKIQATFIELMIKHNATDNIYYNGCIAPFRHAIMTKEIDLDSSSNEALYNKALDAELDLQLKAEEDPKRFVKPPKYLRKYNEKEALILKRIMQEPLLKEELRKRAQMVYELRKNQARMYKEAIEKLK